MAMQERASRGGVAAVSHRMASGVLEWGSRYWDPVPHYCSANVESATFVRKTGCRETRSNRRRGTANATGRPTSANGPGEGGMVRRPLESFVIIAAVAACTTLAAREGGSAPSDA